MATAIFDTYKAVSLLRERGLTKEAAEGIAELLRNITENHLVNTSDLQLALQRQSLTLIKWVSGVPVAHALGTAALTVALLQLLA